MHFNTASNGAIQKTAEATGDLVANKIANKIQKYQELQQRIV